MVRQWQQLFFEKRYSFTNMQSPDIEKLAPAYKMDGRSISKREELEEAIETFLNAKGSYILEVKVEKEDNVFPMVPAGAGIDEVLLG